MSFEENVVSTVHSALTAAIKTNLEGYNSPLIPLIKSALDKNSGVIQEQLDNAVQECFTGEMGDALKEACTKKLAKVLISKMEGEIEKRANELRSSPEFRARLTVAITETVSGIGK